MKKVTKEMLEEEAKKESLMNLKNAIAERAYFQLKNCERSNLKRTKKAAYHIIMERFARADNSTLKNNRLQLINIFLLGTFDAEECAKKYWNKDNCFTFKNRQDAKKIYREGIFLLSEIFDIINLEQRVLALKGLENKYQGW